MQNKTVKEIIDNEYKDYSLFTIYNRAIPSAIDGMKPVQRFVLYGMLQRKDPYTKRVKLSDLGAISPYGYHQGEVSAIEAAVKMAREWGNNEPILVGHGNFGTRVITEAAAPRYIFATLSPKFDSLFIDSDVAPVNPDEEILTPQFYLPVIPWVLINGVRGVAVGFATLILPRAVDDVVNAVNQYLAKPSKFAIEDIKPTFPNFRGEVFKDGTRWVSRGIIRDDRMYYVIDELPYGIDREEYMAFLDGLEEKELITSYTDDCSDTFSFRVKVSRDQKAKIEKDVYKFFGLDAYFTENLTTIGHDGKLKIFDNVGQLIVYFCEYRLAKFAEKIHKEIVESELRVNVLTDRVKFIESVRNGEIDIKNSTRSQVKQFISDNITKQPYGDDFIQIPFYRFTSDEVEKMKAEIKASELQLEKLRKTTPEDRFKTVLKKVQK